MCVMPTGAGKSLCYQLPILLAPNYSLIISPLIALMADQVAALKKRNIPAAFVNSSISFSEQQSALQAAACGEVKLLYVAPERLQTDIFADFLRRFPPDMLIVDEAHCISEWGHDFRPSYRKIGEVAERSNIRQVCAFTATATPEVCEDIACQLRRKNMELVAAGFRRPNLAFKVRQCDGTKQAKLAVVKELLKTPVSGATIIYAATRQAVDELSQLKNVRGYHAGMSMEERNAAQDYFMNEGSPVLAATNAFGMGIDRSDVRRVIHYQLPGSVEAYYQEAGRAGRDGEAAECILLFSYADRYIQNFLIEMNNPPGAVIRSLYRVIRSLYKERCNAEKKALEISAAELKELVPTAKSDGQISAALGILEKCGAIRRAHRQSGRGEMRFIQDFDHLRILHQDEKTQRSRFIHRVALYYQKQVTKLALYSVEELSQVAGLSIEQCRRVLNALNGNVLEWKNAFSGRAIEVTDPELVEPEINDAELQQHLDYEQARLDAVIDYATSGNCRQQQLIRYFGENDRFWSCGNCDNCAGSSEDTLAAVGVSAQDIRIALRAAEYFNGRIGIGKLGQILAGTRSAGIIAGNWHRNPCFGTLRKLRSAKIEKLLRALNNSGDLEKVERNGYPCIKISEKGLKTLRNS